MRNEGLDQFFSALPGTARILNFGGYDALFERQCAQRAPNHHVDHADIQSPAEPVLNFIALDAQSPSLPIKTALYDAVVVSHVIEHLPDPIASMGEWLRVLKPGGLLYIEAPSDRSLLCKSHPDYARHGFFSFWDDPTHRRPWPPAALYRLAYGYGCTPLAIAYLGNWRDRLHYIWVALMHRTDHHRRTDAFWRARKFSCYALIRRHNDAVVTPFRYVTFRKSS